MIAHLLVPVLALVPLVVDEETKPSPPARATIGAPAPPLTLDQILQGPSAAELDWARLKDHVVVLEFWTTWCSPCVAAMPHLNELVDEFRNEPVRFISITYEDESVIREFLKKKKMKVWVALDTDKSVFDAYAPGGGVPVTVLVDRKGRVAALTYPTHVTAEVIRDVLAGKAADVPQTARSADPVDLEKAQERMAKGGSDPSAERPAPLVEVRIAPAEEGRGGMYTWTPGRLEARGWTLRHLMARAFDVPMWRVEVPETLANQRYDILVVGKQGQEASDALLNCAVTAAFPGVRRVQRKVDVYVLGKVSEADPAGLEPTASTGGSGHIEGEGWVSFVNRNTAGLGNWLAEKLERPVLDETGLSGHYDFHFRWDEASPASLLDALPKQVGLRSQAARRTVEYIVLSEPAEKE